MLEIKSLYKIHSLIIKKKSNIIVATQLWAKWHSLTLQSVNLPQFKAAAMHAMDVSRWPGGKTRPFLEASTKLNRQLNERENNDRRAVSNDVVRHTDD